MLWYGEVQGSLQSHMLLIRMTKLLDGRMKLLQNPRQSTGQDRLSLILKDRIAFGLRFRHDSTTVLLHPAEEIGVLDRKTATALDSLKEGTPSVTFEVFIDHQEDQQNDGRRAKSPTSVLPLQIEVHGPGQYYNVVGSTLSKIGMYLQEPVLLDHEVAYRNPHFISWDENPKTPLLNTARNDPEADFTKKVEAILNSSNSAEQASDMEQDPRILTILRKYDSPLESLALKAIANSESHQLSALHFMLTREDEYQNTLSLWEPHDVNGKT